MITYAQQCKLGIYCTKPIQPASPFSHQLKTLDFFLCFFFLLQSETFRLKEGISFQPVTQLLANSRSLKIDYTAACESDEYHCKEGGTKLEVY